MNPEILALENEADRLKSEGDHEGAITKLTEALAIDDSFVRAHLALAVLLEKTGKYLEAVKHAERAVELEPDDSFNFVALSRICQQAFEGTRDPIFIQKAEEALARGHG